MKLILTFSFVAALFSFASPSVFAAQCPANAIKASYTIWAAGRIPHNQTRTATHSCGKRITCNGGSDTKNIPRSCRWG